MRFALKQAWCGNNMRIGNSGGHGLTSVANESARLITTDFNHATLWWKAESRTAVATMFFAIVAELQRRAGFGI
jgi:hypothetical protein